uniref:ISRm5 transposase n=1 Tax=Rhizobium meliloti TaxID=382 RepID=I2E1R0_RHIML|nr:ISRm5 transposase [Sinorhizobium meliloti]
MASIQFSWVSTASARTRPGQLSVLGKMQNEVGSAADFLVEAFQHVGALEVLVMLER